jgi:hypothetical protein
VSDLAYCDNGHELWVERDLSGAIKSVKETVPRRVFVDASFCPVCGAEIVKDNYQKSD